MKYKNEIQLIEKAKKDKKYFAPLYEKYFEEIFVFIFKRIKNKEVTADICSKTFMKAMINLGKYKHQGYRFSSWLYRIAVNETNLFFRETKKSFTVQVSENEIKDIVTKIDKPNNDAILNKVLQELESLPEEQSQLIELRFFNQLSFKEIALIFDISETNAKMRVYRILEKIKKKF